MVDILALIHNDSEVMLPLATVTVATCDVVVLWLRRAADEVDEEPAADDDGGQSTAYHRLLMPELVVSLDAGDDFLRQRVMNLPESVVVGTHLTEDGLTRRLMDYRTVNTDDETVLNYFDELEVHPQHIGQ